MRCKVIMNDIVYDFDKPINDHKPLAIDEVPVEWMSVVDVDDVSDAAQEAAYSLTEHSGWIVLSAQYSVTEYNENGSKGNTRWGAFVTVTPKMRAVTA